MIHCKFRGSSAFPLDMLRYDVCWPTSQEDVISISMSLDRAIPGEEYDISVTSEKKFTLERWVSFGWKKLVGP